MIHLKLVTSQSNSTYCPFKDLSLGLESNITIPDSSLTASSEYDVQHGASRGRLNVVEGVGGWSAGTNDTDQWIQVRTLYIPNISYAY